MLTTLLTAGGCVLAVWLTWWLWYADYHRPTPWPTPWPPAPPPDPCCAVGRYHPCGACCGEWVFGRGQHQRVLLTRRLQVWLGRTQPS